MEWRERCMSNSLKDQRRKRKRQKKMKSKKMKLLPKINLTIKKNNREIIFNKTKLIIQNALFKTIKNKINNNKSFKKNNNQRKKVLIFKLKC